MVVNGVSLGGLSVISKMTILGRASDNPSSHLLTADLLYADRWHGCSFFDRETRLIKRRHTFYAVEGAAPPDPTKCMHD